MGWLIANPKYLEYFPNAECADATRFNSISPSVCQCPDAALIAPCTCSPTPNSSRAASTIDCSSQSLNDTMAQRVVNNTITPSPFLVDTFNFRNNNLTLVPQGLTAFKQLRALILSENQITIITNSSLPGAYHYLID